jgi:hypothetical protein
VDLFVVKLFPLVIPKSWGCGSVWRRRCTRPSSHSGLVDSVLLSRTQQLNYELLLVIFCRLIIIEESLSVLGLALDMALDVAIMFRAGSPVLTTSPRRIDFVPGLIANRYVGNFIGELSPIEVLTDRACSNGWLAAPE